MRRPYFRRPNPHNPHAQLSYTPPQLARVYGFPTADAAGKPLDGAGQTIAIIELGGGYQQSDITGYFQALGLPTPAVRSVSVQGAQNSPGQDADAEVLLDIQVSGAIAPGAAIVVYFAPNTDAGFLAAIQAAIADPATSIISISWGGPEDTWPVATLRAMDQLFQQAALKDISIFVAAGDNGSSDGERGNHTDFPASSPHVTACGGTALMAGTGGNVVSETVWNDGSQGGATGGGVSASFARPPYQSIATVPGMGRGVPDIAADADPGTGYKVFINGQMSVIGGTSAVAPLWAGLTAILNQALGKRVGFLNPTLYTLTAGLRDITVGNNGTYTARPGYDCCTGLGVPDGMKLLGALMGGTPPPPPPPPPPIGVSTIVLQVDGKVTGARVLSVQ